MELVQKDAFLNEWQPSAATAGRESVDSASGPSDLHSTARRNKRPRQRAFRSTPWRRRSGHPGPWAARRRRRNRISRDVAKAQYPLGKSATSPSGGNWSSGSRAAGASVDRSARSAVRCHPPRRTHGDSGQCLCAYPTRSARKMGCSYVCLRQHEAHRTPDNSHDSCGTASLLGVTCCTCPPSTPICPPRWLPYRKPPLSYAAHLKPCAGMWPPAHSATSSSAMASAGLAACSCNLI
jgi:hypothetical protein